jgi:hypothetical protein
LTFHATFGRAGVAAPRADEDHLYVKVLIRVLGDDAVLLDQREVVIVLAREGSTID